MITTTSSFEKRYDCALDPNHVYASCNARNSIEWANFLLRWHIRSLQGDPRCGSIKGSWDQSIPGSPFKNAVSQAINAKRLLEFDGFYWQAEKLDSWINRARAAGDFLPGRYHPKDDILRISKRSDPKIEMGGPSS